MNRCSLVTLALAVLPLLKSPAGAASTFVRGDANADGSIDIADPVAALLRIFLGGPELSCMDAADADDNGTIEVTDAIRILGYLFLRGPAPESPFPDCGVDPPGDPLDCMVFPSCKVNLAPRASFSASAVTGIVPLTVDFDASASSDPDGRIIAYLWDFGDGAAAEGVRSTHTYDQSGNYTARLTVKDDIGESSSTTFRINARDPGIPPDPIDVAPPLDGTSIPSFGDTVEFLYSAGDPVQTGVDPAAIVPARAAVLRGRVLTREGDPLVAVTVKVLGHPELGSTATRPDGMFDLVVNGGGALIVEYEREGHLPAQRRIEVPWQDYVMAPDVALCPLDAQVTVVDLTAAADIQVAQGTPVTDADGTRQATILFPQGTTAEMVLPDGSTQPLTSLDLRATEFTVGPGGPQAMPGDLPPTSAYTYAVELAVDEAMAAGAVDVRFSTPLPFYVENFLGFPVGTTVPLGSYDRTRGVWIPAESGKVIGVLSVTGGLADLDIDGDGLADDSVALTALSITGAERERLAALYSPGQSLWRVRIAHFTPWDLNWPYGPPDDAVGPDEDPEADEGCEACSETGNSIIEVQNQILGESVGVVGTPFGLHYSSDRGPGRKTAYTLEIPLSGSKVPQSLRGIDLDIGIAGRLFRQTFGPAANQRFSFAWDGKDAYGRTLQGPQSVKVRIGYCYKPVYNAGAGFGQTGKTTIGGSSARDALIYSRHWEGWIGTYDARAAGLAGWTLSPHHAYVRGTQELYRGDGRRENVRALGPTITTVAGTGLSGYTGDGGPATEAQLVQPVGLAVGPDGSLYIASSQCCLFGSTGIIRRVDPEGIITTVAGTGSFCAIPACGDDGPATQAQILAPRGLAVGPDNTVYISETGAHWVRKIGPDGIIRRVGGTGVAGFSGDGGPAHLARLNAPSSLALGPDGAVYIADAGNSRIRQVGPDGIITTVAGTGNPADALGDGGPATLARIVTPSGIAVGSDGSLTIAGGLRVRWVTPDGIIRTIAGTGVSGFSGDGSPATEASFRSTFAVAVGADDSVYVLDQPDHRIRWFRPGGAIDTLAGTGARATSGDTGPARQAQLQDLNGLAVGPDGAVYLSQANNNVRVRRIAPLVDRFVAGEVVPAADGSEVYIFTAGGLHLRTLDALTGALRHEFAYDGAGRLASVTDRDGNVTTVERDAAGSPMAIVGPFGQVTELEVDQNGYLSRVTNPAGEAVEIAHEPKGLLASVTWPGGQTSRYRYDAMGRIEAATDPTGATKTITRGGTNKKYTATSTTPLGRPTTYTVERLYNNDLRLTSTDPAGVEVQALIGQDGRQTATLPDGTRVDLVLGPDPRWGMRAPFAASLTVTTPGGRVLTTTTQRTVTLANPDDPLSLRTLTDTVTTNGRVSTSIYDAATRTLTRTTPGGRRYIAVVDERGRPVQEQFGDLEPVIYAYDNRGRLSNATQGVGAESRVTRLGYGNDGFVTNLTDPINRTSSFTIDADGRGIGKTTPDGREIRYAYDLKGNFRGLTPPGRPEHTFSYTARDEISAYTPPAVGAENSQTRYTFDPDRQPRRTDFPDGRSVDFGYDANGRLSLIDLVSGDLGYGYDEAGRLKTLSTPLVSLGYASDGGLLTGTTWSGDVAGSVTRTYDNDFRVTAISVNGSNSVAIQYSADSLPVQVGDLVLIRAVQTGLVTATALGATTDATSYDGFGAAASYTASQAGSAIYSELYTRDSLGRMTSKTETTGGGTRVFGYTYDLAGRLIEVRLGGVLAASYAYDANGNRLSRTDPSGTISVTYDDQDRLIQYGAATYDHTPNGERESKSAGNLTTIYQYDGLGNLTSVILPDGTEIEYLLDGQDRRVGRRVNGTQVQAFLYQDRLRPIAELDGAGAGISRFVYATGGSVPDYMVRGGVTYRIISDHLGSPRLVLDAATGQIAQRMDHDEFGRVTLDTNPGFQPFGFAGGLYDRQTGLVHFGAREYDPETGRWTTKDPILFAGGDTNLYGYVKNDPVNHVDPDGLIVDSCSTNPLCVTVVGNGVAQGAQRVVPPVVNAAQRGGAAAANAVSNLVCRVSTIPGIGRDTVRVPPPLNYMAQVQARVNAWADSLVRPSDIFWQNWMDASQAWRDALPAEKSREVVMWISRWADSLFR
ncbi:MAG: PKD domain-containing protein [Planctomycetes bacterium]|nr:PKD domain-containing protein [Planctomycetota bacterium]